MKKISLLPVIALFIGVGMSAFTTEGTTPKKSLTDNWYKYRGPLPASDADLKEESNYFLVDTDPGCNSNEVMCAVFVPGTGENPDPFTAPIENDIVGAVHDQSPISGYIELDSEQ